MSVAGGLKSKYFLWVGLKWWYMVSVGCRSEEFREVEVWGFGSFLVDGGGFFIIIVIVIIIIWHVANYLK